MQPMQTTQGRWRTDVQNWMMALVFAGTLVVYALALKPAETGIEVTEAETKEATSAAATPAGSEAQAGSEATAATSAAQTNADSPALPEAATSSLENALASFEQSPTVPEKATTSLEQTPTQPEPIFEPAPKPAPLPVLTYSNDWQYIEVRRGDTLSELFSELELEMADLARLLRSGAEAKALNSMKEGHRLGFKLNPDRSLREFRLAQSPLEELLFTRKAEEFSLQRIEHTPRMETALRGGVIRSSLLAAAEREQVPPVQSMRMVEVFGGKIDFMLDTRPGDEFAVLYEQQFLEDEYVGEGELLVARFVNRGKEHLAVRYENLNGQVGYFSPNGNNMQTGLMRNPLDVFRISSHFSPRRFHPILRKYRPHKGTDYAAPAGTPVRATSDGTVTRASRFGDYGNIVIIDHSGGLETRYAHLSRFAQGVKPGIKVYQGQVVGYVGATGSATGPHLHYEVLKNGVHRNPSQTTGLTPAAPGIAVEEIERFNQHAQTLLAQFNAQRQVQPVRQNASVSAD